MTKNKLKTIYTGVQSNTSEIEQQKITNLVIDNSIKNTIPKTNIFQNYTVISSDWVDFISLGDVDEIPSVIFKLSDLFIEIERIPETWIPYIRPKLLFRYVETEENRYFGDSSNGIFIEQEDIEDETSMKKVVVHAGIFIFKTFFLPDGITLDDTVNKNFQVRLDIILKNPKTFL